MCFDELETTHLTLNTYHPFGFDLIKCTNHGKIRASRAFMVIKTGINECLWLPRQGHVFLCVRMS